MKIINKKRNVMKTDNIEVKRIKQYAFLFFHQDMLFLMKKIQESCTAFHSKKFISVFHKYVIILKS